MNMESVIKFVPVLVAWAFIVLMFILLVFSGTALFAWFTRQTLVLAGYEFGVASVGRNAVVAYDSEKCPDGWVPFRPGIGRFVIGSGDDFDSANWKGSRDEPLEERSYRDSGGAQRHEVTVEELPAHSHRVGFESLVGNEEKGGGTFAKRETKSEMTTEVIGGSMPHSIMPPFIPLRFCKKQ